MNRQTRRRLERIKRKTKQAKQPEERIRVVPYNILNEVQALQAIENLDKIEDQKYKEYLINQLTNYYPELMKKYIKEENKDIVEEKMKSYKDCNTWKEFGGITSRGKVLKRGIPLCNVSKDCRACRRCPYKPEEKGVYE